MPEECIFCGIVAGKVPAKKVHEDSSSLSFLDISPRNPGHTLVIPKSHYDTVIEMPDREAGELFASVKRMASAVKDATKANGISIVQSNGKAAGQAVPHVHFHIIPRFDAEGPVSLEAILSVKKMDETSMEKIAESIKSSMPEEEPEKEKEESTDDDDMEMEEEEDNENMNFNF